MTFEVQPWELPDTLRRRQNGHHLGRLYCQFKFSGNDRIQIQASLKLVPKGPIDDKTALVQLMTWRRTGDKPLPEPMIAKYTDAYMRY